MREQYTVLVLLHAIPCKNQIRIYVCYPLLLFKTKTSLFCFVFGKFLLTQKLESEQNVNTIVFLFFF